MSRFFSLFRAMAFDPEELDQVAALARIEAERTGFDPELAAREAVKGFIDSGNRFAEQFFTLPPNWDDRVRKIESSRSSLPVEKLTGDAKRKRIRHLILYLGSLAGISERDLAMSERVSRSRMHVILANIRAEMERLRNPGPADFDGNDNDV